MKKIAVAGAGAIGCLIGGYITKGGQDCTLIEPSWREHAEAMKAKGLTLEDVSGKITLKVNILMMDELSIMEDKIEILFLTVKSNDTVDILTKLKPYLAEDVWVVSPQNGINEDVIIPIVGEANVVPCVSYTGASVREPGFMASHGGHFVVGELNGDVTLRVQEIADLLNLVTRTEISDDIMKERWSKLSQVTMTVTIGCILGLGMGVFQYEKAHTMFARVMCENLRVAKAAGCELDEVNGLKRADWERLAQGPVPEFSKIICRGIPLPPGAEAPQDPITISINMGLPLEIDYTNGYVINKGRELGIPTPVNELIVKNIRAIENGTLNAGLENLDEMMRLSEN